MLTRPRTLIVFALVVAACSPGPSASTPPEDALVIAENVGSVLAVVSLAPAEPGANEVRIEVLGSGGERVDRRARIALLADGREVSATDLAPGIRLPFAAAVPLRGTISVPAAGAYEVTVSLEGQAGSASIRVELPARRAPDGLLATVDDAMNALASYRERQTLSGGGPAYDFRYEYRAPDRLRYTFSNPGTAPREAILIGDRRWDRALEGHDAGWVAGQGGAPIVVPSFAYAAKPRNARVIGHEGAGEGGLEVIAFVDGARGLPLYHRLWVEPASHRVQRYVMMAVGHYMRGTYADFDRPIEISAP